MLKQFLARLLGSADDKPRARGPAPAEPVEYRGYRIVSCPKEQAGQFRVSGVIQLPGEDDETLEYAFERSDMLPDRDACDAMMVAKARRFIDETGEAMFQPDPRRSDDAPAE